MNRKLILTTLFLAPCMAWADLVNVTGNIRTTQGNIVSDIGYVKAQTYFLTPGYVQAGGTGTFGGLVTANAVQGNVYLYTPGYLSVTGAGYINGAAYIGDFLRLGGAANTPASKSVQIGQYAITNSFNALVVGQYNVNQRKLSTANPSGTTPSSSGWNPDDPLFEVGNGADATHTNTAFMIYKDGSVTMSKAQGDIGMGQFGN
jgi:hypothetical protein